MSGDQEVTTRLLMMDVLVVRALGNNGNADDTDDADLRGFFLVVE